MKQEEEKCCGNCCWFYDEMTDGEGFCAEAKDNPWGDFVRCDKACRYVRGGSDNYCFVSKKEMRYHMVVLLQYHLADEDMNHRFSGGEALEDAMVFAYKYMKVFSEL